MFLDQWNFSIQLCARLINQSFNPLLESMVTFNYIGMIQFSMALTLEEPKYDYSVAWTLFCNNSSFWFFGLLFARSHFPYWVCCPLMLAAWGTAHDDHLGDHVLSPEAALAPGISPASEAGEQPGTGTSPGRSPDLLADLLISRCPPCCYCHVPGELGNVPAIKL